MWQPRLRCVAKLISKNSPATHRSELFHCYFFHRIMWAQNPKWFTWMGDTVTDAREKKLFWLNKSTWYSMFCVSLEKCPLHYLLLNQQTAVLIFLNCRSPLKQRWNTVEMYFSGKLGNPKSTLNSDISSRCNINLVAPYLKGVGGGRSKNNSAGLPSAFRLWKIGYNASGFIHIPYIFSYSLIVL